MALLARREGGDSTTTATTTGTCGNIDGDDDEWRPVAMVGVEGGGREGRKKKPGDEEKGCGLERETGRG